MSLVCHCFLLLCSSLTTASVGSTSLLSAGVKGCQASLEVRLTTMFSTAVSPGAKTYESTLWGPTCDSADFLYKNVQLPELRNGDWLLFPNVGAYTVAGACDFNGGLTLNLAVVHNSGLLSMIIFHAGCSSDTCSDAQVGLQMRARLKKYQDV